MKLFFNYVIAASVFILTGIISPQNYNSSQLKNEALSLMNNGRYGEAIDLLNKYVSQNPRSAEGFNLRGLCYEKRNNYEYAVYDYRTASKLSQDDKEIISNLNRATKDWYRLLYNKIEGHKREIAINPNTARNYLETGKCYKNLGEWGEAEIWYDIYLDKEEASADEILRYAEILAKNNHISKGEPVLKSYTDKYPSDHRLWSRYGYFQLWLGKSKSAIESFNRSLKIRPFFKEAMDGLDLARGKGYIYSINDTASGFNYGMPPARKEYIIDKYFRQLKNNPADDDLRFRLVGELIKAKRFEEAGEQLKILSIEYSRDSLYLELLGKNTTLRKSYFADRIRYFENILSINPSDKTALLESGKFYSYSRDYDSALKHYKKYLDLYPTDRDVQYRVIEILTWQNNLCEAQNQIEGLLESNPLNLNYHLMSAKINFWLNENLDEAKNSFKLVIEKDPLNKEAIAGLSFIELRNDNYPEAEFLITKLESMDKSYPDLQKLKSSLVMLRTRKESEENISLLDKARELAGARRYDESLDVFEEYLKRDRSDKNVMLEAADVHLMNDDYKSAIKIYDEILKSEYDFDTDKQRAKVLLWKGDSLSAVREFKKMLQKNPQDIETRILLGDAYLRAGQLKNARVIYEELLTRSPDSHILKTRLNWAGGGDKFSIERFPTFVQVIPNGYYFTDNIDFKMSNIGLKLDFGLTGNIALGISGSRGNLDSKSENLRFSQVKGSVYLRLTEILSASGSFGVTYFTDNNKEKISELNISLGKKDDYRFSASLSYSDAALILYSPLLVNTRLNAYLLNVAGNYTFKNRLVMSGKYAYIDVSDNNSGNLFQFRLGKYFEKDLSAGYEYYFYSFDNIAALYWSPENFESHSIWTEWNLIQEGNSVFTLGGKIGLIPQNDFILSELFASFSYSLTNSLSLNARFITGSSSRSDIGYRSTSLEAGLFWNL